ncbi:MAG: DMT family transporter, partial [Pseudomonadales bacterium]
ALMLHFTQAAERMTRLQWSGVLLAFSGIAATFLLRDSTQNTTAPNMLWGDFLALLSGFCWACATVTVRNSKLNTVPAAQTLLVQVVTCTVILSTASLMTSQLTFNMTAIVTASLLYQGLIVCSASFLTWFWLLRQYPAAQLGVFAFMTPMFGIIFGMWLLDEPLEQSFLAGSALVMLGITLVTLKPSAIAKLFSRRARKPSEEKCP